MNRTMALLLALAALLVAACGDGDTGPSEAAGGAGERPAPTDGGGGGLDRDGTLRYSTFYEPSRFDPHRAANAGDANALFLTYDRLIHLSSEAEPQPGLAQSWAYRDDGRTLQLDLREGVTFHDGQTFDAAAVKANLERAKTVEGSVVANDLSNIVGIEAPDPTTVVLRLAEPQASLLAVLSDRHGAMISPAAFDDPELDRAPVGAGMYRLVEYRAGDRMTFERYDDYWDPEAVGAARVEYVLIGDSQTRLNGLRSGELDVATIEPSQVEEAEAAGLTIDMRTTVIYQQMYMNRTREPFDDVRVRQALNYGIDRQAIVDALDFGLGEPNSQIFPEGYWAFNEDVGTEYYHYDPERARTLLAEAGFPDGFSFEMLLPTPGTPAALAEILQQQFADIGVEVSILQTPAQTVADVFFVEKEGSAMLGVWSGRQDPSMTTALRWTSTGFSNPGGHTTPEIEQLHARAASTLDPDERAEAMHELVAAGTAEALDLVIYNPVSVHAAADTVAQLPQLILNGKVEFRGAGVG